MAQLTLRLQVRVAHSLLADRSCRPVTGETTGFIGQSQQARMYGIDDLLEVPARQIRPPDASGKKSVAGNKQLERSEVQADRSLCVARRVHHSCRVTRQPDNEPVRQAFVRRSRVRRIPT